jgi:hypothetical protein
LTFAVLAIGAAVGQLIVQDQAEEVARLKSQGEQHERDSIHKMEFRQFALQRDSVVADALGKYGFKLDSVTGMLVSLRDSVRTTIIEPERPVFQVAPFGGDYPKKAIQFLGVEKTDTSFDKYRVFFRSDGASSCCFDIKSQVIVDYEGYGLVYVADISMVEHSAVFGKGQGGASYFEVPRQPNYIMLYLWVHGTYKNSPEGKSFNVDDVCFYNKRDSSWGTMKGIHRNQIMYTAKKATPFSE